MNAAAKRLTSMRRNPRDWQISELQSIARQHNINWRHQKSRVPAHRPIKPIYVQKFIELIDGA
jgi:hypothetical protein